MSFKTIIVGDDTEIAKISNLLNHIYAHHEQSNGLDKLVPNVVSYKTAKKIVEIGLNAINKARDIIPHGIFVTTQTTAIENRRNSLLNHQANIDAASDSNAPYPNKDALRQDIIASFVELDASIAAADAVDQLSFWAEVGNQFEKLGRTINNVVDNTSKFFEYLPWVLGGLGILIAGVYITHYFTKK